jgi:hypothetical protein
VLQSYRADLKHGRIKQIEKDHIIEILNDEDESFRFLLQTGVQRSFVNRNNLTPETASVLRKVLLNGSIRRDLNELGIRVCYENGWLHSEPLDAAATEIVCVFPTRLHEK